MTNEVTNSSNNGNDDGLGDLGGGGGNRSLIQGVKVVFANTAEWVDKSTMSVIKPDHRFVIWGSQRTLQTWLRDIDHPVDVKLFGQHERWPGDDELEELNEAIPREQWRADPFNKGQFQPPVQRCWFTYWIDPLNFQKYTFPTSTIGGFKALSELQESIAAARAMWNDAKMRPVVTLGHQHMPTRFGGREIPRFIIVDWKRGGSEQPALTSSSPSPALPPASSSAAKDKNADMGGDYIPH
jgi:hypothetical protein